MKNGSKSLPSSVQSWQELTFITHLKLLLQQKYAVLLGISLREFACNDLVHALIKSRSAKNNFAVKNQHPKKKKGLNILYCITITVLLFHIVLYCCIAIVTVSLPPPPDHISTTYVVSRCVSHYLKEEDSHSHTPVNYSLHINKSYTVASSA